MQELDTSDEDTFPGRHRAPASLARKATVRLGIAVLGVLVATGLGVVTADLLDLTRTWQVGSEGGSLSEIPLDREEEPRVGRAIDLTVGPPLADAPQPADLPVDPVSERPAPVAAAVEPAPASSGGTASPAPVRRVRTGDTCPAVGRTGVTGKGDAAVCTASPGNGPNKWRVA